jgi:hypothetical protein
MKQKINIFYVIVAALFLLGTMISAHILYDLASALEKASPRIDLQGIEEAEFVLFRAYWIIGLTLLAGMVTSILLLSTTKNYTSNKIVAQSPIESFEINQGASSNNKKTQKQELMKAIGEIQKAAHGIQDSKQLYQKLLSKLCMKLEASQGLIYEMKKTNGKKFLELIASFSFKMPEDSPITYDLDEGLVGQVARTGKKMNVDNIPQDYIKISSGLGAATPGNLVIIPIFQGSAVSYVAEIASFGKFSSYDENLITKCLTPERDQNIKSTNNKKYNKQENSKKRVKVSE